MKTPFLALIGAAFATGAMAHVGIDEPRGAAGATYEGVVRVGHGCAGSPTTGVTLQLPEGITKITAKAPAGWSVTTSPRSVSWKALPGSFIGDKDKGEFPIAMTLPSRTGPLWLKAVQACETGSVAWTEVPQQGTGTAGMKAPALLIDVMSPAELAQARALPKVEGGWIRATVAGQRASGAFMKLTAKQPMQLVSVSTPVAGTAEVHEMKMEGDVMRMRPAGRIDLRPGEPLELKPGGFHLMLQDLRQPLEAGSTVPVTLTLRDAKGVERRMELQLPVALQAPGGATPPAGMQMHKH